jgi:hypothetical protein
LCAGGECGVVSRGDGSQRSGSRKGRYRRHREVTVVDNGEVVVVDNRADSDV